MSLSIGRLALGAEAKRRWRVLHFNVWSRGVCRLLGGRTNIVGTPPAAPFFLVSNHLSYLDILVLAQYLPCRFVAKSDVARWPVVGYLTRIADTLYINRTRRADIPRANAAIHNALLSGDSVALFPEGTSSNSDWALPIKAPLLQVAADNGIDVHTAAIRYDTHPSDIPAQASICYFGDDVFGQHIWRLFHLRGFTTTLRFCEQPVSGSDRKTLAANVEDSIHSLQALTNEKSESLSPDTFNNRSASHSSL
ncbi:MAG: lysophospholipid acyltransferase family protein [Pseudomonadota bacterium]